jgi:hypothetical protein
MKSYGYHVTIKRELIDKMHGFGDSIIAPMVKAMREWNGVDYDDDGTLYICPMAGEREAVPTASDPLAQRSPCDHCICYEVHYKHECESSTRLDDCPDCREVM